ncbi:pentapeptide repeat-containing protein [Candidatus Tisiphia endosymbiont of Oplodontha viridula]|uniref:WD40 domain-containing protein n=1 Tax=Candidatus Tisiphia endosymbiont of Oplodontha viridula TaxID=3077925 RepID=UPI0035C8E034
MPESKQLEAYYIAPINYNNNQNLEEYVKKYVTVKCNETDHDEKYYLDRIDQLKIRQIIDTGFMFKIVMESVPSIKKEHVSKQDIYDEYVKIEQNDKIKTLYDKQKEKIVELLNFNKGNPNNATEQLLEERLKVLGKYIATQLHLQNVFRIKDVDELFKAFGYEGSTLFKQQALYHILKLLPLKIETKTLDSKIKVEQKIEIGFIHDIIKNYYLFETIKDEIKESKKSEILASHSIVKNVELIKLIAEDLAYNKDLQYLQEFLRESINETKQDKSDEAVTLAANSITLLVAAQYSFSGEDLNGISIIGANIRNGIFQYVDFSNANLTGVNLTNANLVGAKFIGTNMNSIELSIHPDLEHNSPVNCVSYSPDGNYLASGSDDETVKIWNAENGSLLQTLGGDEGHTSFVWCISYSPDGKYLASGSNDKTVKIWNAENDRLPQTLKCREGYTSTVGCISYSPDGQYLASGSWDKTVRILNAKDGSLFQTLGGHEGHTNTVWCISYSPDGKYLASCSSDNTVKIWHANNGSLLQTLGGDEGHTSVIRCISYAPNGNYLASGSDDKTVKIWNIKEGKNPQTLKGHTSIVGCIKYSPNGEYLASCSLDKTVKIWHAENGRLLKNLRGHEGDTHVVGCISYSPDGKYLASCSSDNTIKIWQNGSLLQTLAGHTSTVSCISYSPDGKYLTSGSWDSTVKIWQNGSLLQNLAGHTGGVDCISYSPDGNYLASGSDDETVKIWGQRSNPQPKEDMWYLSKEISATETPLVVEDSIIEEANISTKNQKVFEQKGAKVLNNRINNTENKEVNSNEVVIPKKTVNKEPNALLKEKLELAAKQKTLKLVKVKSKFIKEPIKVDISTQNDYTSVNVLVGIKYDNPLLNNPMLLKKLASNLNINLNKAVDASDYLTNLFGSKNFNYICNSDQNLLQELLGNYCEY